MEGFHPILIGGTLALAAGAIGVMAILRPAARAQFVYGQLCVMVGIYVGFAIVGLDGKTFITRGDWSVLLIEAAVGLGFLFAGLAVLQSSRHWLLGVLVLGHGAVDLGHLMVESAAGPAWYAFACVVYDAAVGVAAIMMLPEKSPGRSGERAGDEPPVL
jgi:hypothetical protein